MNDPKCERCKGKGEWPDFNDIGNVVGFFKCHCRWTPQPGERVIIVSDGFGVSIEIVEWDENVCTYVEGAVFPLTPAGIAAALRVVEKRLRKEIGA